MTSKTIAYGILKAIGILILISLLLYFIYVIQSVLIYIIIAVITTLFLFLLLIVGLVSMFVPLIISQGNNLSLLDTVSIENRCAELYLQLNTYLANHNIDVTKMVSQRDITSKLNFNFFTDFFNSVIGTISGLGIGLAAVFFISFFFLKDKVNFIVGMKKVLPDTQEQQILNLD